MLEALKKMDDLEKKLLIVLDNKRFVGLLSAGDIQRAIINNLPLDKPVVQVLRKNIRVATPGDTFDQIKKLMLEFRMELCPVVDQNKEVKHVYYWEELFADQKIKPNKQFNVPVIIMAGGLGTRLKPLTNVLPKPLIPIGEKTMLEEIFERFSQYGCSRFYISVNYKAEMIKHYVENLHLPYNHDFFIEHKPMGTAGSISLLKGQINETFFVSNCDILIDQDYSEILEYHKNNNNEITIIAALKHFPIAYGTIETGKNGKLLNLIEKPELTFKINSGMYILEPHLIDEIPGNTFFHITQLIEKVKNRNGSVGVFPVSEKSWKDIGSWKEIVDCYKIEG